MSEGGISPNITMDIKSMIDRRQVLNKKGTLTDGEIKSLVREWHNVQTEEELNQATVEMELRAMEKELHKTLLD